jgi:hypothetical protein
MQKKDIIMVNEHFIEVERPSGGGPGWLIAVVLVIAVIIGALVLANQSNSSARKDGAIAAAADEVGKAASKAGDAAEKAADKVAPPN